MSFFSITWPPPSRHPARRHNLKCCFCRKEIETLLKGVRDNGLTIYCVNNAVNQMREFQNDISFKEITPVSK